MVYYTGMAKPNRHQKRADGKTQTSISLREDLLEKAKQQAESEGRSFSRSSPTPRRVHSMEPQANDWRGGETRPFFLDGSLARVHLNTFPIDRKDLRSYF
mgnify:CR=1 FL=1